MKRASSARLNPNDEAHHVPIINHPVESSNAIWSRHPLTGSLGHCDENGMIKRGNGDDVENNK